MNEYLPLPSLDQLKLQAKRLRSQMVGDTTPLTHSQSLELLAHQYGYKNWNILHAAVGNQPPPAPVSLGARVSGYYLGLRFEGEIIAVRAMEHTSRFDITINFDQPMDVVKFDGMTNFRRRVSSAIGLDGKSVEKTSDNIPVMQLDI